MSEEATPDRPLLYALSMEQIREIAFQSAGHTAGIFMRRHPDDTLPEQTIKLGVDKIVAEVLGL